jgi:enoyl-[acyl-carrier-protein] reductase (NADH)
VQTERLVQTLYAAWGGLDSVVTAVAFAGRVRELSDLTRESLALSLNYTAWPVLDLVKAGLGQPCPPKRFLALSSPAADARHALPGYDMVAVSKAAMEALVGYLAIRLKPSGISINVLRLGPVDTESLRAVLPEMAANCESRGLFIDVSVAARAAAVLVSGLMDDITGEILTVGDVELRVALQTGCAHTPSECGAETKM